MTRGLGPGQGAGRYVDFKRLGGVVSARAASMSGILEACGHTVPPTASIYALRLPIQQAPCWAANRPRIRHEERPAQHAGTRPSWTLTLEGGLGGLAWSRRRPEGPEVQRSPEENVLAREPFLLGPAESSGDGQQRGLQGRSARGAGGRRGVRWQQYGREPNRPRPAHPDNRVLWSCIVTTDPKVEAVRRSPRERVTDNSDVIGT